MTFFKHLYRSLWDIEWLRNMKDKRKETWLYFFLFMFLLVVAKSAPFLVRVPEVFQLAKTVIEEKVPNFQADIKDGVLGVTELEQPYTLDIPVDDNESMLIYVDTLTDEALSAKTFVQEEDRQTVVLLTRDYFEIYNPADGSLQSQSFKEMPDSSLAKSDILGWLNKWKGFALYLMVLGLFLVIYVFAVIGKLVYLLVWSLLLYIIAKIARRAEWKFGKIYTLGLSAIILPSVLLLIAQYLSIGFPFLYTFVFFVLTLAVMFRGGEKKEEIQKSEDRA
ncbi:MAG: DUF1189 family protein [Candidatus Magasanikbacteria bacterium]|nr:DUF1189 family protein [Candidatus Magasanikbacteria bacterium]